MAVATTTTAGDLPLAGVIATAIKITSRTVAGAEATEYVSIPITTPASLTGKQKIQVYMRPGTNFIASEWTVSVYQSTTRQSLSTDSSSVTYLPNGAGKFTTTFDAVASTAYTLRFARPVNAGGNAGVLNIAGVIVGPGIAAQGAAVGLWRTYTPVAGTDLISATANTVAFGTTSANSVTIYRRGETALIYWAFKQTAAGSGSAGSGNYVFKMPTGLTINTAITGTTTSTTSTAIGSGLVGRLDVTNNGANETAYDAIVADSQSIIFRAAGAVFGSTSTPTFGSTTCWIGMVLEVPVNEWAGSGTVNLAQNDVQYYYGTGGTWGTTATITAAQGPGGVLGGTTTPAAHFDWTFTPATPIPVGASPQLQVSPDGIRWSSDAGIASTMPVAVETKLRFDGTNWIGAGAALNSDGTIRVRFGRYPTGTGTQAWTGTWYWRVAVGLPGQAVGFGAATATSLGLVKGNALPASDGSGSITSTDLNGEVITTFTSVPLSTGLYTAVAFYDLPSAGNYEVTGIVNVQRNGGTYSSVRHIVLIGDINTTISVRGVLGSNYVDNDGAIAVGFTSATHCVPNLRVRYDGTNMTYAGQTVATNRLAFIVWAGAFSVANTLVTGALKVKRL